MRHITPSRLLEALLLALVIAGTGTIGLGALLKLMVAVAWWWLVVSAALVLVLLTVAAAIELAGRGRDRSWHR